MSKTPHKCPVCSGRGQVPSGFYDQIGLASSIDTSTETCRSCGGSGIVWDTLTVKSNPPGGEPWTPTVPADFEYVPSETDDVCLIQQMIKNGYTGALLISCPCRRCTLWCL